MHPECRDATWQMSVAPPVRVAGSPDAAVGAHIVVPCLQRQATCQAPGCSFLHRAEVTHVEVQHWDNSGLYALQL